MKVRMKLVTLLILYTKNHTLVRPIFRVAPAQTIVSEAIDTGEIVPGENGYYRLQVLGRE